MSTVAWPDHLLTLGEWVAMPEDSTHRLELVEGVLLVTPRPGSFHQHAMVELTYSLNDQLPDDVVALAAVEVVVDAGFPPTVRAPDVVVVPTVLLERNAPRFQAADVLLAVEIVSPGSGRTDRVMKFAEYAEAGIAHCWIVDLDPPVSLTGHLLVDGNYELMIESAGVVEVASPTPIRIDLDALTRR
jgi:Uma2 family endonuclease